MLRDLRRCCSRCPCFTIPLPRKLQASPPRSLPTVQSTTTLADQSDLAVTVYNSNVALVRDVRQLTLPAGDSRLRFMDIAASINPATVHFRSLTEPHKVERTRAKL